MEIDVGIDIVKEFFDIWKFCVFVVGRGGGVDVEMVMSEDEMV